MGFRDTSIEIIVNYPFLMALRGGGLSHISGWQYIRSHVRAPHQNGLAERAVRSLRAAAQSIAINENRKEPFASHSSSGGDRGESLPARDHGTTSCVRNDRQV